MWQYYQRLNVVVALQAFSLLLSNIAYEGMASGSLDTERSTHRDFSPTDCQVRTSLLHQLACVCF
jgi:hypothetical protein